MGDRDTICGDCRAKLEAHVMSVKASDYPEREAGSSGLTDDLGVPISETLDPQLADAVAQDPELLPLAPLDEPRVAALAAGRAPAAPVASPAQPAKAKIAADPSRTYTPSAPARPAPPSPVPVIERPVVLNPPSRWKLIIVVILCIAVCAVLAGVLWSFIVPQTGSSPTSSSPTTTRAS